MMPRDDMNRRNSAGRPALVPLADNAFELGAASPAEMRSVHMSPIRAVLRFKWTAAVTCLLIVIPAIAGVWYSVTPLYRTRATVEISPTNPRILYKTEDTGLIPMYQQYLNSQVGIIVSNTVLQRVIERTDVQATAWYQARPVWPLKPSASRLERLREGLIVRPRGRTFLIDVDFIAKQPADARVIVDAVVEEYRAEARNRVKDTDLMVLGTLEDTLKDLNIAIAGHEQVVEDLSRELGTSLPEELIAQKRLRLDELEASLANVRRELQLTKWKHAQVAATDEDALETAPIVDEASASVDEDERAFRRRLEKDTEWWRLHLAVADAETKLERERQRLGSAHPTIVSLSDELERLRAQQEARARQVAELGPAQRDPQGAVQPPELTPAEALAQQLAALKAEHDLLTAALEEQRAALTVDFGRAQQLTRHAEELRKQKSKAEFVRTRLDEKETERGPIALIRVVSRPLTPTRPFQDRRLLFTGLIAMAGMGAGVASAVARGLLTQTIDEAAQLSVCAPLPMLGALPYRKQTALPAPDRDTSLSEVDMLEDEQYRMLRTALLSRCDAQPGQVLLVTSSAPGAGKTTVSVRLARSLARGGKRTILIDADLRAPAVARKLDLPVSSGLVGILRQETELADAVLRTDMNNLDILPTARAAADDAELLASGAFADCLDQLRQQYDIILVDSPPVLPVADARILARQADGTILVIRERHCRQSDVANTLTFLHDTGTRLLGTIYIGARSSGRYNGYRGYGYGYGYGVPYNPETELDARAVSDPASKSE